MGGTARERLTTPKRDSQHTTALDFDFKHFHLGLPLRRPMFVCDAR